MQSTGKAAGPKSKEAKSLSSEGLLRKAGGNLDSKIDCTRADCGGKSMCWFSHEKKMAKKNAARGARAAPPAAQSGGRVSHRGA